MISKQEPRAQTVDNISARAKAMMNDERWRPFRSIAVRRVLAVSLFVLAALTAVTAALNGPWGLINVASLIGLWFVVRRVNRGFVDLPDELVDERVKASRNESFRLAYICLAAIIAILVPLAAFFAENAAPFVTPVSGVIALFWVAAVMPTAVFVWRETEI